MLCCWILLAFLVDVSRSQRPAKDSSQENDKPEDAALPKDTDAASSNSSNGGIHILRLQTIKGIYQTITLWVFDRDARRSGPTIHFVNLFPLLLVWVFSTQMSNN